MDGVWGDEGTAAERFLDHYHEPRGRIRATLTHRQLVAHFPAGPLNVLDLGGGGGQQALALAGAGHRVTLLDRSRQMLSAAEAALEECDDTLRRRVTVVLGAIEEAGDSLPAAGFDAVLCHGVLMYLPEPDPVLDTMVALCRPGGLLSVLTKNAAALALRPALQGDFQTALDSFDKTTTIGWLGVATRGDTVADLALKLANRGVETEAWYGVGVFSDHRMDPIQLSESSFATLLAAEWEASRRDPYRGVARLFHLLGRRVTASVGRGKPMRPG